MLPKVDEDRLRYLSFLGVSRILQPPTDPPLRTEGLRVIYAGPDARIYANDAALPRAFVVGAQRRVDDAYTEITSPAFDARRDAVVEAGESEGMPGLAGPAQILHTENDRQVVETRTTRPGMLVVSDAWAPGWHARDGRGGAQGRARRLPLPRRPRARGHAHRRVHLPAAELADRVDRVAGRVRGAARRAAVAAGVAE